MTWILGTGSIFGYAALIADTRVVWPDGRTADVLQKIHPVTSHLMVGFSGSVRAGFTMLADMREFLDVPPGEVWYPRAAAWFWWRRGRRLYSMLPHDERSLGCELLLAGISARRAALTGHMAYCIQMEAPQFYPNFAKRGQWVSIGSGAGSEAARRIAEHQANDPVDFLVSYGQGEVGMGLGGSAKFLAMTVGSLLSEEALPDVGEAVQLGIIESRGFELSHWKRTVDLGEPTQREIVADTQCTTWEEFEHWAGENGAHASVVQASSRPDFQLNPLSAVAC